MGGGRRSGPSGGGGSACTEPDGRRRGAPSGRRLDLARPIGWSPARPYGRFRCAPRFPTLARMRSLARSLWAEPRAPAPPRRVWRDWVLVAVLVPTALIEVLLRDDVAWPPV